MGMAIAIFILLTAFGIFCQYALYSTNDRSFSLAGSVVFMLAGMFLHVIIFDGKNPKPIDVYRGRTTLEVTYRDGVPTDTVVIFKTEQHHGSN